jgi:hypothetical protein
MPAGEISPVSVGRCGVGTPDFTGTALGVQVLRDLRKRGNFDRLGRPLLFAGAQWDAPTAAYVDRRNGLRAPRIRLSGPLIQIEARKP